MASIVTFLLQYIYDPNPTNASPIARPKSKDGADIVIMEIAASYTLGFIFTNVAISLGLSIRY